MDEADYHDNGRYFQQVDRINGFNKNLEERTIEHRVRAKNVGAKDERVRLSMHAIIYSTMIVFRITAIFWAKYISIQRNNSMNLRKSN